MLSAPRLQAAAPVKKLQGQSRHRVLQPQPLRLVALQQFKQPVFLPQQIRVWVLVARLMLLSTPRPVILIALLLFGVGSVFKGLLTHKGT